MSAAALRGTRGEATSTLTLPWRGRVSEAHRGGVTASKEFPPTPPRPAPPPPPTRGGGK